MRVIHYLEECPQIRSSVFDSRSLERINLSGNEIHRAGAVAVVKALRGKPRFDKLDIDANEISADGIAEMKVPCATPLTPYSSSHFHSGASR